MVQTGVVALPGVAPIQALGIAAARRFVNPAGRQGVGPQGMDVVLGARLAILPGQPGVQAAHHATQFDAHEKPLGHVRIRRNPSHVVRPGTGWEAPRGC